MSFTDFDVIFTRLPLLLANVSEIQRIIFPGYLHSDALPTKSKALRSIDQRICTPLSVQTSFALLSNSFLQILENASQTFLVRKRKHSLIFLNQNRILVRKRK